MKITTDQVRKVATLARLGLSPEELEQLTNQLDAILGYMEQLKELDTSNVQGTSHVLPLWCPERPDEIKPSFAREVMLSRAPQREEEFFLVPKIIE